MTKVVKTVLATALILAATPALAEAFIFFALERRVSTKKECMLNMTPDLCRLSLILTSV
jgi:hypothetical protein